MSDEQTRPAPFATTFDRQLRPGGTFRETALSVVLHVGIIALLVWKGSQTFVDANQGLGEGRGRGGGGGGGGVHAVAIFAALSGAHEAPAPPVVPPPVETEQLVVPKIVTPLAEVPPPPRDTTPPPAVTQAAVQPAVPAGGPGLGEGQGSGTGPGSGSGTGGGAGAGVGTGTGNDSGPGGGGGTIFPPQPQGIILPPQGAPRELRGTRITVTFRISARGEVVDVSVDPPIRDRGYRNEFLDRMRRYTFTPGYTRDRHPVASQIDIQIVL